MNDEQEERISLPDHYDLHHGCDDVRHHGSHLHGILPRVAGFLARPIHHRLAHRLRPDDGRVARIDGTHRKDTPHPA